MGQFASHQTGTIYIKDREFSRCSAASISQEFGFRGVSIKDFGNRRPLKMAPIPRVLIRSRKGKLFIYRRPFSQAGRSRLGPFPLLFVLKPYSPMEYPVSNPAPFVPIGRRLWMQMELPAGRRVLPESTTLSASNSQHQRVQPLIEKIPILRTCGNPRWTFTPTRHFPNSPIHRQPMPQHQWGHLLKGK